MVSTLHVVAAALGAVLLLIALVAFFRSLWRAPPKWVESPDGIPGGVQGPDAGSGGHGDGSGHA